MFRVNLEANGSSISSSVPEHLRLIVSFTYLSTDIRANVCFYGQQLKPNPDESSVERFYRQMTECHLWKLGL